MAIAEIKKPNPEKEIMFSGEHYTSIADDFVREKELESLRYRIDSQYDLTFKRIDSVESDIYGITEENMTAYKKIEELESKLEDTRNEILEIFHEIDRQKAAIMLLDRNCTIFADAIIIILILIFVGFIVSSLM